ncbi:DUF465 domain-containing protein [Thioclava sp. SK-1]|uniref:YdcH family protein n=1 Tax=Thioclava sp. SK-1 TaxID=1889770 RepID=UPI0008262721|nr:DUF465 domain-containing protein [Thioclava sp. SK-1]OCX62835.1 DUF465 domain-containing protein [Thioclava sp. SK-1]
MSLGSHINELRRKHQALSLEVEQAARRPAFDDLHLSRMKKQKLQIKQEISRLERT